MRPHQTSTLITSNQIVGYSIGIREDMELPPSIKGFIITLLSGEREINLVVLNLKWRASLQKHRGQILVTYTYQTTPRERGINRVEWLRLERAEWPSCTCACKPLDKY